MNSKHLLSVHIKNFFNEYLINQRGLSKNTIYSYRDTFKILTDYISINYGCDYKEFTIFNLDVKLITNVLNTIEKQKNNSPTTRNIRLSAIHSFFKYLSMIDETYVNHAKKILSIPIKKTNTKTVDYLEEDELNLLFKQINTAKPDGFRNMCIILLLYNTGARASEIADAKLSRLKLIPPSQVHIVGKGNKPRITPLWDETVKLLNIYIKKYRRKPNEGYQDYLFIDQRAKPLTRFGIWEIVNKYIKKAIIKNPKLKTKKLSVHSLRHTSAVHQKQAGLDLNVIKSWLGHTNINTTARYLEVDLNTKRKILENFRAPNYVGSFLDKQTTPEQQKVDLDNFLKSL